MEKMKLRYTFIAAAILVSLLAISCKKDFLDRAPGDNLTEEEMFSKIETAEQYLDNAYVYLPDFQYNTEDLTGRYKLGGATDEIGFQQGSGYPASPFDINLGNWNPNRMPMERNWSDYYSCIRRCNMFIKDFDLMNLAPVPPQTERSVSLARHTACAVIIIFCCSSSGAAFQSSQMYWIRVMWSLLKV